MQALLPPMMRAAEQPPGSGTRPGDVEPAGNRVGARCRHSLAAAVVRQQTCWQPHRGNGPQSRIGNRLGKRTLFAIPKRTTLA